MKNLTALTSSSIRNLLLIVSIFFFNLTAKAHFTQNRLYTLTVEKGLAHTDATCFEQDKTGLIWIGTNGGLQSFDGDQITTYDFYEDKNIQIRNFHNRITALKCNGDILWVASKSSLVPFCLRTHQYLPMEFDCLADEEIMSILLVHESSLWVKTNKSIILFSYDVERKEIRCVKSLSKIDNVLISNIADLFITNDRLWFNTRSKISVLKITSDSLIVDKSYTSKELTADAQTCHIVSSGRYIYLSTPSCIFRYTFDERGDIDKLSLKKVNVGKTIPGLPAEVYGKFIVDRYETIWGIWQNGLYYISTPFHSPRGNVIGSSKDDVIRLTSNFLSSLFVDSLNNLWIGTWGGGVNYLSLNPPLFNLISEDSAKPFSINGKFVTDVIVDEDRTLWILTQKGGLNHYDKYNGLLATYSFEELNMPYRTFKALAKEDHSDVLYIGTMDGLIEFNKRTKQSAWIKNRKANRSGNIFQITDFVLDGNGYLWISTWRDGIYCYSTKEGKFVDENRLNAHSTSPLLTSNTISQLYLNKQKSELFVCTDRGLNRVFLTNPSTIANISYYQTDQTKPNSITSNFISSIDQENDSTYWVGTIGGGAGRVVLHSDKPNDYSAQMYTLKDGLTTNDIEIVLFDGNSVWLGGIGITKYDPYTKVMSKYDFSDGLQSNSFKIGSAYKDKYGILYLGGVNGLNYFNPTEIKHTSRFAQLMFLDLYIKGVKVKPNQEFEGDTPLTCTLNETKELLLNYRQNDLGIVLSSLNYNHSNHLYFRYRLNNDSQWRYLPLNSNTISFENLDYGTYLLMVEMSTDGGATWENDSKSLSIIVSPPWWSSLWAKLGYLLLASLLLYIIAKSYLRDLHLKHKLLLREMEEKTQEEHHQMKLQFFVNVSHEFKTPLTLILSAFEQINMESIKDNEFIKSLKTIDRNAHKLLNLINELMDFRKADLKMDKLFLQRGQFVDFIHEIVAEFKDVSARKGINLQYISDPIEPFYYDVEKITKIVYNLVSNSVKYINQGGDITIQVQLGSISKFKPRYDIVHRECLPKEANKTLLFIISDTGIGIEKEHISKIYDRFFQVESKNAHVGTGIGLAVVKKMVHQHGGSIIVSSEQGVGTQFVFSLPIDLHSDDNLAVAPNFDVVQYLSDQYFEHESVGEIEESIDDKGDKPTLLLVEDNKDLLISLHNYFRHQFNVITAENGVVALQRMEETIPDIVVSDIVMPQMDGIQLCQSIRENLQISYIPVILLTAKSDIETQIECYELGADLYIPKPFLLKLLKTNIWRLLKQKRNLMADNTIVLAEPPTLEAVENQVQDKGIRSEILIQKNDVILERISEYIISNMDNYDLSVTDICKEMGLGRTRLYATIRELTGKSLGDFIRDLRLEKASDLLRNSDKNISEVIAETGFTSNSHFSKIFRLKYGMSPSEYLKSNT